LGTPICRGAGKIFLNTIPFSTSSKRPFLPSPTREHPLFQQHPLTGHISISTGEAPTPYHIYDGHATFVGGTANLDVARELLRDQHCLPVQTRTGRALMAMWIVDGTDASLGPHQELQFSLFVSREPLPPLEPHPFAIPSQMLSNPKMKMMARGLWNNTELVVTYNREYLGLDVSLTRSEIHRENGYKRFNFHDEAGVVNPITPVLPDNQVARTYTKPDAMLLQFFDPAKDALEFGEGPYQRLDFQPDFVQHMRGFKFVYMKPERRG
jgi:hypothetical protein